MKQIYTFFAVMMMAVAMPKEAIAYDFSAVAPNGQTLYYSIIGGKAQVVSPNAISPNVGGNGYSGFIEPTGNLEIPNSVTFNAQTYVVSSIGACAFKSCSNITSVTISDSVSIINYYAFAFCSGLTTVNFNATNCTIMGNEQYLVFKSCPNFQVLNIGKNVKKIPVYGFWRCGGLTTVNFNADSCTTIGNSSYPYVFYECDNFTTLNIGNNVKMLPSNAFRNCTMINSVNIPDSVTSIGSSVFYNCSSLDSVSIGEGLTTTGDYTFVNCSSLSNVIFSNNITSIGYSAFSGCTSLSAINLPQSITLIDVYAFRNCTGLTELSIPSNVTSIGSNALFGCTNIDSVFMNSLVPPQLGNQALHKDYGRVEKTIVLSGCSFDEYYNAPTWTIYRNYLQEKSIGLLINLTVNNETMGGCEIIQLRGRDVRCDSSVIIQAFAYHGYEFEQWSTGRTNNPDTIFLLGDSNVTAIFSPIPPSTLSLESSDESKGTVMGSGLYVIGDTVTAIGVANYNYRFMGWSDGSSENPRLITMAGDSTLTAYFLAADTIDVHDTTYIDVPYPVHDTTYIDVPYPVHDTTYIDVPYPVHDTTYVDVFVHDTTYIDVPIHDTTYVDVPYPVHDTTVVHDTTYVDVPYPVHDTTTVVDTMTITDTITVTDTVWMTLYDTVWLHDTVVVHDTVYIHDEGIEGVEVLNAKIYQRDGRIVVESGDGGTLGEVRVFDVTGRMVAGSYPSTTALRRSPSPDSGEEFGWRAEFEVPVSGTYIVKIGNHSAKKIVVIR